MEKYRKKPVVIEAVKLTNENFEEVREWIGEDNLNDGTSKDEGYIGIITLEGDHSARVGEDWIIKGIKGEFYPCKDDIFEATYEKENDEEPFIPKKEDE